MYDSFPVCRTILNNWIYENSEYFKIWITMLSRARYLKEPQKGLYQKVSYELQYGQFIFGRIQWSKDLKISEQKIRTCIKKLLEDNMILLTRHTMNFTLYEIVNYAKYNQRLDIESKGITDTSNQRITNGKPTDNQRITTNEESKEGIRKNKTIFLSDSIEYRLADFLRKWIRKNNPNARVPDDDKLNNWCRHIDLMIRIDKRKPDEIKEIIEFAQKDSFWCKNILSTEKLRKQYDQLTLKMKGDQGKEPNQDGWSNLKRFEG